MSIAKLILKSHDNDDGNEEVIIVDASPFKVGRRPENNAQIFQPDVSGCHAILQWDSQGWSLVDNHSTNGTFLNGQKVAANARLRIGDIVHFATRGYQVVPWLDREDRQAMSTIVADPSEVKGAVDLYKILDQQRTYPHFQPIVDLNTNATIGWEALGRGASSEGPVSPGDLFRLAAANRVESRLSIRFRESAQYCVECQHCWSGTPGGQLWVNLHPAELLDDRFMPSLKEFINSDLGRMYQAVVEMPESWVCNTGQMGGLIHKIRDLGMKVAYDDFGAGQSRIQDLFTVPPDFLKLDRELIAGLDSQRVKHDLVQAIVKACRELNVTPLGEGIETKEELEACKKLGISLGQGYYLCRPKPAYDLFSVGSQTLPQHCVFVKLQLLKR